MMGDSDFKFEVPAVLPDGRGGFGPCPDVLTEGEAVLYLRLNTIAIKNPSATLRRYRDSGLLRGVQISKSVFYLRCELEKFLRALMETNPR